MTDQPPPWFYWEAVPHEREEARNAALEEEGYLANEINWGRALAGYRLEYEVAPHLHVPGPEPTVDEILAYTDPIAALLQAAVYVGFEPEEVLEQALATMQAVYEHSADVARRRIREQENR